MKHYDAIVVGCGAIGSATSYNLAERRMKTLVLDRFGLNNTRGSSHGKSRIFRTAYFEDGRYVPLLLRGLELWRELEAVCGYEILRITGGLMIGMPGGRLLTGTLASARRYSLPHRTLSSKEAMELFPAFRLEEGIDVVHEDRAGVLFPERCVRAYTMLAQEMGAEVHMGESVNRWRATKEVVEVETNSGVYVSDLVVIAAGPWTGAMLDHGLPLECERQVPFWFKPHAGTDRFVSGRMPIFISEEADGRQFYGVPDVGDGVKLAEHHNGIRVNPDENVPAASAEDSDPIVRFADRKLPGLEGPVDSTTCIYTNTPDGNFIIDFHPSDDRLLIVSACSGHGFKFSSVIGEIVGQLAETGSTAHDISLFRLSRFEDRRFE